MTQLTRFASQTGYALHGSVAYGRTNGLFFNVTFDIENGAVTVRAYIRPIESLTFRDTGRGRGIDLSRISEYLEVRRREFLNTGAQADERSVWVTLHSDDHGVKAESAAAFVYEFSRFLSDRGYVSSCASCPATRSLICMVQDGQVLEVCDACQSQLGASAQRITQSCSMSGSYLRGAFGAVLGGIAGFVPWVLLGLIGYVAALGGLLMAYFSYMGYRLLRGKQASGMLLIIVAVLIVFTYAAVMVNEGIAEYRTLTASGANAGLFEQVGAMMTAPFEPQAYDTRLLWLRLGTGWLFAGIGSFALMLRRRREIADSVKNTSTGRAR
jgi:hypothetical protein